MNGSRPTVYVIDDDAAIRKALTRLLTAEGYDVKTFTSARDFLDLHYPGSPACLILDVRMPRMSGFDLKRRLEDEGIDIPIIFISGHGNDEMAAAARESGAVDFLHKPLLDTHLLDTLKSIIDRQ